MFALVLIWVGLFALGLGTLAALEWLFTTFIAQGEEDDR